MILEYYRPETLEEALSLLSQTSPKTVPLGGGTVVNAPSAEDYAVVDLQGLGWDKIEQKGRDLQIGATASCNPCWKRTRSSLRWVKLSGCRQPTICAKPAQWPEGWSPLMAVHPSCAPCWRWMLS